MCRSRIAAALATSALAAIALPGTAQATVALPGTAQAAVALPETPHTAVVPQAAAPQTAAPQTAAPQTAAPQTARRAAKSPASYCRTTGGKVVVYHFFDYGGHEYAGAATMCRYKGKTPHDPDGVALVRLATLYTRKPTLAALAYEAKKKPTKAMNPTPAAAYCKHLGALPTRDGYWAKRRNGGQIGLCTFSDGSYLEQWTLYYNAAGEPRGIDLNKVLRFHPSKAVR